MDEAKLSGTDIRRYSVGNWPAVPSTPDATQQQFLDLLNAARSNPPNYGRQIGVDLSGVLTQPPFAWSPNLGASALTHSMDMAGKNYFGHDGSDGTNPGQRMAQAGYSWTTWAESIAAGTRTPAETLAALIVDQGVPDLGHRKMLLGIGSPYNMLRQIGIAQAAGGQYGIVWTLDAAAPANTIPVPTPQPQPQPQPVPGPQPAPGPIPTPQPGPTPSPRPRHRWRPRWWPAAWPWLRLVPAHEDEAAWMTPPAFAFGPPSLGVRRSNGWPAVEKEHLRREPTCAACGGTAHLAVHHVKPFHLFPHLELEDANLITLCEAPLRLCHFRKGHFFNWASYNVNVRADAAAERREIEARP